MTLAHQARLASIALATVLSGAIPADLLASSPGILEERPPQVAPAKPSPDVAAPGFLPPTRPTQNPASAMAPAAEPLAEHFAVDYTDGKVSIDATNASLSKLLHEVAAKAGIKITGSVSDERVFGLYGPASPSVVLAALLDGTGANMLLVDGPKGGSELVLTQRLGGPTPPNALATALETTTDEDGKPVSRYSNPKSFQPPGPGGRGPLAPPPNFGPPALQSGTPANPSQGEPAQNSGDSRTPQQIYDQLQNASQKPQ